MKKKIIVICLLFLAVILKQYINVNYSDNENTQGAYSFGYTCSHSVCEQQYSNNKDGTHQTWKRCKSCFSKIGETTASHSYINYSCACGASKCQTCKHDCNYQCNSSCTCCCIGTNGLCASGHYWTGMSDDRYQNNKNGTHYVWNECIRCGYTTPKTLYNGHGYADFNNWTCRCGATYCPTCGHDCDYQCNSSCTCCCGSGGGTTTNTACYCVGCSTGYINTCNCTSTTLCSSCSRCPLHCICTTNPCYCLACLGDYNTCGCSGRTLCSVCSRCSLHCTCTTNQCYCVACNTGNYDSCGCSSRTLCGTCNKCPAHCSCTPISNYTLTINPNGGTWNGKTTNSSIIGASLSSITISVPIPASGYVVVFNANGGSVGTSSLTSTRSFSSWSLSGSGSISNTVYTFGNGNATLTANYRINSIILPSPEKSGYTFKGWYTDPTGGTKVGNANESYTPTSNRTLYAQWDEEITTEYAVIVNPSGGKYNGSTSNTVLSGTTGSTIAIANSTPPAGYTITFDANSGSVSTSTLTASKTFESWTVDGYGSMNGMSYTFGSGDGELIANYSTNLITLPTPTRTNYVFKGWYTSATDGTLIGNAGASYTPTSSRTLYAHWEPGIIETVNVTVNPNGGTWNGSTSSSTFSGTYGTTRTIAAPIAPNNGYTVTFNGSGGTSEAASIKQTKTFSGWGKTGDGGISGTVFTFGTTNTTLTASYTSEAITLPNATKNSSRFAGWYSAATGGTKIGMSGETYSPISDVTLYAQWTDIAPPTLTVEGPAPKLIGKTGSTTYTVTLNDANYLVDKTKFELSPAVSASINVSDIDSSNKVTITVANVGTDTDGEYSLVIKNSAFYDQYGNFSDEKVCDTFNVNTTIQGEIRYSTTTPTKGSVVATFVPNYGELAGLKTMWIDGQVGFSHIFTENGEYVFNVVDSLGNTKKFTAKVDWIVSSQGSISIDYDVISGGTIFTKVLLKTDKTWKFNTTRPIEFIIKNGSGIDVTANATVSLISIQDYYGTNATSNVTQTFNAGTYLINVAIGGNVFVGTDETYEVALKQINIIDSDTLESKFIEGFNKIEVKVYGLLNLD